MMRNSPALWLSALGFLALPLACSGDDGGGSGGGSGGDGRSSGVQSSKQLTDLSAGELDRLCSYAEQAMSPSAADACQIAGVGAAAMLGMLGSATDQQVQQACQSTYEACMDGEGEATEEETCEPVGESCTATVAEAEACLRDAARFNEQAIAALPSCSELTLSDLLGQASADESSLDMESAACDLMDQKCPDSAPGGDFVCANGSGTLPTSWVCDGDDDCGDGSDEAACP